jgi:4-hydroxyphenylacetate 3-monooxygenase oxygenase component
VSLSTGENYLSRIRDSREVWLNGERIIDVTQHALLKPVALQIATLYDMQHTGEHDNVLVCKEDGETVARAFVQPKSVDDIIVRRQAYEIWANAAFGMLGRTPDYMNTCMMALASANQFFAQSGNKVYADNLVSYYKHVRALDLYLTHTFASPQVDRSKRISELPGDERFLALRVANTCADGVIVHGARLLATSAPICDEIISFGAGRELSEGEEDYAVAFAVPVATPGLKFLCRESFTKLGDPLDHPLAARFDEIDAVAFFDNVLIPWDRVFVFRNVEISNQFKAASNFYQHVGQQVVTRAIIKSQFILALTYSISKMIGIDRFLHIEERLGEMIMHLETLSACLRAAEADATETKCSGVYAPSYGPIHAALRQFPRVYPRLIELLHLTGGSGFISIPTAADMNSHNSELIENVFRGAERGGRERIQLFRLAWDIIGEAFGSRQELFERFFLGDPTRALAHLYRDYDTSKLDALIKRVMKGAAGD